MVNQWRCLFSEQNKNKQHYHNHNGRDCQTARWYNHYQSLVPKKPRKWTAILVPVAEKKSSLYDTRKVKGCFPIAFKFLFLFWNNIHVHWRKYILCIHCTSWYRHFMSIENFRYVMLASFSFSTNFCLALWELMILTIMCRTENSQRTFNFGVVLDVVSSHDNPSCLNSHRYFVSDWHMAKVQHCSVSARWHFVPPTHCVRILTAPLY